MIQEYYFAVPVPRLSRATPMAAALLNGEKNLNFFSLSIPRKLIL